MRRQHRLGSLPIIRGAAPRNRYRRSLALAASYVGLLCLTRMIEPWRFERLLRVAAEHVQHNSANANFVGGASISVDLTGVATGNAICVFTKWGGTAVTVTSVTDTESNSYTVQKQITGGGHSAAIAYALNVTGNAGTLTITVNYSGTPSPNRKIVIVHEASGVDSFDGGDIGYQDNPGTSTDAVSSPSITPTIDGCYIFGATADNANTATSISAGTGFTGRVNDLTATWKHASENQIQASAGSIAATFTQNDSFADYHTGVIALAPPAGVDVGEIMEARQRGQLEPLFEDEGMVPY